MEENVALDSSKQKQFVKSIKGIKKLLKKNEETPEPVAVVEKEPKDKKKKKKRKVRQDRGLVYLSHIPHGFYENAMTQYFKQFGVVTNARVIRSKRTGNSKGFAFVEFRDTAVAEIVAETMNNYLMGKRLIKAVCIPPEKQKRRVLRKRWNSFNNPANDMRLKMKREYNSSKDEEEELKSAKKMLLNLNKLKKKLNELGINYDDFTPVDIPPALLDSVVIKTKEIVDPVKKESEINSKKKNKNRKVSATDIKIDVEEKLAKSEKQDGKKVKKEKTQVSEVNKKEQKQKEQKLKDAGVKLPENFIQISQESDSDDSTYEFDSDEYENMINEDDNSDFSSVNSDDVDNGSEEEDESVIDVPPKRGKPSPKITAETQSINIKQEQSKKQKQPRKQETPKKRGQNTEKKETENIELSVKRKALQKTVVQPQPPTKKPKFEKQSTQQKIKKQFKKKK